MEYSEEKSNETGDNVRVIETQMEAIDVSSLINIQKTLRLLRSYSFLAN